MSIQLDFIRIKNNNRSELRLIRNKDINAKYRKWKAQFLVQHCWLSILKRNCSSKMILKLLVSVLVIGSVSAVDYFWGLENRICRLKCPIIEYDPICASDGRTYGNACYFRCARKFNRYLDFRAVGMCGDDEACSASLNQENNCAKRYTKTLSKLYKDNCTRFCNKLAGDPGKEFNEFCENKSA